MQIVKKEKYILLMIHKNTKKNSAICTMNFINNEYTLYVDLKKRLPKFQTMSVCVVFYSH